MKTKSVRVIVPNTVYLTNLPDSLTEERLSQNAYLGQYGALVKVVRHRNRSAHIVYACPNSADLCMDCLNGFYYDGCVIAAAEGTTKYAEDIDHAELHLANLREPIRPVPLYSVFPAPSKYYQLKRPSSLGLQFLGNGTLVDKTWAGMGDRLSPGSILNVKSGFMPFVPKLDLSPTYGFNALKKSPQMFSAPTEGRQQQQIPHQYQYQHKVHNTNEISQGNKNISWSSYMDSQNGAAGFSESVSEAMSRHPNMTDQARVGEKKTKTNANFSPGSSGQLNDEDGDELTPRGIDELNDDLIVVNSPAQAPKVPPGLVMKETLVPLGAWRGCTYNNSWGI